MKGNASRCCCSSSSRKNAAVWALLYTHKLFSSNGATTDDSYEANATNVNGRAIQEQAFIHPIPSHPFVDYRYRYRYRDAGIRCPRPIRSIIDEYPMIERFCDRGRFQTRRARRCRQEVQRKCCIRGYGRSRMGHISSHIRA